MTVEEGPELGEVKGWETGHEVGIVQVRTDETLNQENVMGKAGWNVVQNHFGHKFTSYGAQISVEDEELGRSQRDSPASSLNEI